MTTTQIVLTVVGVGLVGLGLWIGWLFIKHWYIPMWQARPEPDEKADAENAPINFSEKVVTGVWGYGSQDEYHPEGHGYYFPDDGLIKIYYRHWEGEPVTEKEEKPATDEADAKAIFEAFMQEKSMALIDNEFYDPEFMALFLDGDDDDYESLNFESGDVAGFWIPFPWDWDEGRVYFYRGPKGNLRRITKYGDPLPSDPHFATGKFPSKNTNKDFCTLEQDFQEH
jgi:hypothetical protein